MHNYLKFLWVGKFLVTLRRYQWQQHQYK